MNLTTRLLEQDSRVVKRAESYPEEVTFVDEDGNPLDEYGILELDWPMRLLIAENSLKWKQGFEKTLMRMIMKGIRISLSRTENEALYGDKSSAA